MAKTTKTTLSYIDILKDDRDSQLVRNSELVLLMMLSLRVNPTKQYSCFPSYQLLSRDTGLDMTTLKRAARSLEGKNLIRRKVRPNHSNLWYLNVGMIQQAAEENRASAKTEEDETGSPFDPPVILNKDGEGTSSVVDVEFEPRSQRDRAVRRRFPSSSGRCLGITPPIPWRGRIR
jgi:DNA-binding MarR family transcriptional regulator